MGSYLLPTSTDHNIFCVLGICLHFDLLPTARGIHFEAPYFGAVVTAYLFLLGIKSDSFPNEVIASSTPDIERHLKSDDQNALVQFTCPFSERMLTIVLQENESVIISVHLNACNSCKLLSSFALIIKIEAFALRSTASKLLEPCCLGGTSERGGMLILSRRKALVNCIEGVPTRH